MVGIAKHLAVYFGFISFAFGTNVHVNNGCILVNEITVCKNRFIPINGGGAEIYARFNGKDKCDYEVIPGCHLSATWPSDYGDVFFGADNCLYDNRGHRINNQCCDPGTGGPTPVFNPYWQEAHYMGAPSNC